jgi:transposase
MGQYNQYSSDLSDQEWETIKPLLVAAKPVGRPRQVSLREVIDAIFYRADHGIKGRDLPSDCPAWQTVYGYFSWWVRTGV